MYRNRLLAAFTLTLTLMLAACGEAPSVAPPSAAARLDTRIMSLAAQRFDQFCIASIGGTPDGVDLANVYYKASPIPPLGTLKVSLGRNAEDIGVQFDTRRNGCMVTSSQGKAPNGKAELRALAEAYAARNGGTVQAHSDSVITVKTPARSARFQFWDARDGLSFLVES
ncbi:hypothetical protein ACDP63_09745 [Paracoccus sp. P2]|uniref:Lipoprotein n=1 Tax=Paracoccus pantotrophus TaxID=82367 RepID=A0A7H9BPP1_PARPN|nr:hypothetical protein [Paracoccus pantotrophus]MDF3855352.1 hypothetical protein [Paracoccus pantotrophus]QLH12745.1 hypothetical protein HYQ43_00040 [Paracoccus pantotrophus]RDD96392.1 hypothetical protein DTW92_12825 [Paracoccus pantotrophus]WGR66357.1 hypothetical protein E3U24_13585 [Paracoccus pantotrophus]SFO70009.1 hypothetical protein SAMN04244567_02793 [Paracoccus pantotrophus]